MRSRDGEHRSSQRMAEKGTRRTEALLTAKKLENMPDVSTPRRFRIPAASAFLMVVSVALLLTNLHIIGRSLGMAILSLVIIGLGITVFREYNSN
jgi:hypothetical protein